MKYELVEVTTFHPKAKKESKLYTIAFTDSVASVHKVRFTDNGVIQNMGQFACVSIEELGYLAGAIEEVLEAERK